MIKGKAILSKAMPVISVVFSLIWLNNLAVTDAYFSVYVLIAFFSLFLRLRPTEGEGEGRMLPNVLSAVFSALMILANYPLFTTIGDPALISRSTSLMVNLINTVFSFAGGIFVAHPILVSFFRVFPMEGMEPGKRRKWVSWAVFGSLVGVHLIHLFLVEYPGNLTEDTFAQMAEMVAGSYSNFNTFWHTMMFQGVLSVGYALFGDVNAAAALFCAVQAVILCGAFTWCLVTMADYGMPKWLVTAAYLIYAVVPYNMALSISVWKDVLFAAGCLLLLTAWLRIQKGLGDRPVWNYLIFALGSLLFFLSRTNGWMIYLGAFLPALLVFRRKKAFLILMGTLALTGWVLLNPVLSLLNVPAGDLVESLSLPIQQVSRVIAEECPLTPEEEALLDRVVDLEEVPSLYTDWFADPMKVEVRSKDYGYFQENLPAYRSLWLKLGVRYPVQYLKAWVDLTKGYWNGGYPYALYSETVTDNPYGVEKSAGGNLVASLFRLYFGLSRHVVFFEPLHSIGLYVWLLWLCFLLNLRKRREQWLLTVPLLILVAGLWLGTPVYCCFRYVYPLFVSMPLLLGVTLFSQKR